MDLSAQLLGVDLDAPVVYDFTIGDYIIRRLQKTLEIIMSSPEIANELIIAFANAKFTDRELPLSKETLLERLKSSSEEADEFLEAQSRFFVVPTDPFEFKVISASDWCPVESVYNVAHVTQFVGSVEKVRMEDKAFARHAVRCNYDFDQMLKQIEICRLIANIKSPHLQRLRFAYKQDLFSSFVMSPWGDFNLSQFLKDPKKMSFWAEKSAKEKFALVTDWMACMASGLSSLHSKGIIHREIMPENVLFDSDLLPVICDFGLSKTLETDNQPAPERINSYLPPEMRNGLSRGRKSDIFSLGLVFLEIALLLHGHKCLMYELEVGVFMSICTKLDDFYAEHFPTSKSPIVNHWNQLFTQITCQMLQESTENRPEASDVWAHIDNMVELLGSKPHCTNLL